MKQKNNQAKKIADEAKKNHAEEEERRQKMETDGYDFKPKIKKKEMTEAEKEAIEKGKN